MNAIAAVVKMAHEDWHRASMPWDMNRRYSYGAGLHFATFITADEGYWQLTICPVVRDGGDPNTDRIDYANVIYQQKIEQLAECAPHPMTDDAEEVDLDNMSSLAIIDWAMSQVQNAATDVAEYDDESETLNYHARQLDAARRAMSTIRNRLSQPQFSQ